MSKSVAQTVTSYYYYTDAFLLILTILQFVAFSEADLGVVVTLSCTALPDEVGPQTVVVGVCAALEKDQPISDLKVRGLATPNWEGSVELVLRHYPAGVRAAGLWVRLKVDKDEKEELESLVKLLLKNTNLKVHNCVLL